MLQLTPKKSKEFLETVADELGYDKTLVKKVVDHYWARVYKAIVNIEHSDVTVANLGTFSLKKKQLNKKMETFVSPNLEITCKSMKSFGPPAFGPVVSS